MLPKSSRLSRKNFFVAKKTGHTISTPLGRLSLSPLFPLQVKGQISVVTSSKLHRHAVVRNHLRRLLYNSLITSRLTQNIIIYPSPSLLNLSDAQISSLAHQVLSSYTVF